MELLVEVNYLSNSKIVPESVTNLQTIDFMLSLLISGSRALYWEFSVIIKHKKETQGLSFMFKAI